MRRSRVILAFAVLVLATSGLFFSHPGEQASSSARKSTPPKQAALPRQVEPASIKNAAPSVATAPVGGIQISKRPGQEPSWALRYGKEFWRARSGVNFGAAIDRVKHSFDADKRPMDVKGATFAVDLDGRGFRFSPFLPGVDGGKPTQQPGVALQMQTTAIRAGNSDLYRASSDVIAWSINGNIAQGLLSPENQIVEHYDVRKEGMSVTWLMNQKPQTSGDVEIQWRFDGLRMGGATATGHHFYDSNGKARVRVGNATAVDANGRSIPLQTEVRGNALVVNIPQSVIETAGYPLAIDPIISAEFELDQVVLTASTDLQYQSALVYNGWDWLLVWQIETDDIFGAVVSADGTPHTTDLLTICSATGTEANVYAAANADGSWLVTWTDLRNGTSNHDVYGAIVNSAGEITTADNGFVIRSETGSQDNRALVARGSEWLSVSSVGQSLFAMILGPDGSPQLADEVQFASSFLNNIAVASGEEGYYLAWKDNRAGGNFDIYGTYLSSEGVPAFSNGDLIAGAAGVQQTPTLVYSGSNWLIAWLDERAGNSDLYGKLIAEDGAQGTEFVIADQAANQSGLSLAWNGSAFYAVWADPRGGTTDIYGTLISATGVVTTPNGAVICDATANQNSASLAAVGTQFLVAWNDFRAGGDIYGAIINGAGVQQTDAFAISDSAGVQVTPFVSPCSADALVTWRDESVGAAIYGASVFLNDASVVPTDGALLTGTGNTEENVAMAAGDETWFVAWEDNRNQSTTGIDIYGMMVDSTGEPISTDGIVITDAAGDQTGPAVAANASSEFLVAWENEGADPTVYAAAIGTDGTVLQADGFLVADPATTTDPSSIYATGNGSNNWLVWYSTPTNALFGKIVQTNATITNVDPIAAINAFAPAASGSDTDWLVVSSITGNIVGAKINANGSITLGNIAICSAAAIQTAPVVTFNGTDWFTAWIDPRSGNTDIYGARITSAGSVVTADIAICTNAAAASEVAISTDGDKAIVVWNDFRNSDDGEIYGAFLSNAGVVQQTNGFSISGTPDDVVGNPEVAANSSYALIEWESGGKVCSASVEISDATVTLQETTNGDATIAGLAFGRTSNIAFAAFDATNGDGFQHWTSTNRAAAKTYSFGAPQTVDFEDVPDRQFTRSPIPLSATSTSALGVDFEVVSGPGTIDGDELTLTGVGTLVLRAYQEGNASFEPASATQTVVISKRSQSISFSAISTKNFSNTPFSLSARSSLGLPVTYRVLSGPARISGNRLTMTGLGAVRVDAYHLGNSTSRPASAIRIFTIADTTKPKLAIDTSIKSKSNSTRLRGKVTDNHRAEAVTYRIRKPGDSKFGPFKKISLGGSSDSRKFAVTIPTPDVGNYLVEFFPLDEAGNTGSKDKVTIQRE